ncbi:MAG: gpW family head-tail joining protein [Marinibacterium sp.]
MTLAEQLSEAQLAYHKLQIGESAVSFTDQNGERVEYTRASAPRLAAYIEDLKRQIAGQPRPTVYRFSTSKGLQ